MKQIPFQYDDGGRQAAGFKGDTGDCVVRAIAIAAQIPYQEVYNVLSEGCRSERKGKHDKTRKQSARDGVHVSRKWFKDYMMSIGWTWTPTMQIGSGCKVHLVAEELPSGRLIASISKHWVAVIDGVIHDIYDSGQPREYSQFDRGQEIKYENYYLDEGMIFYKSYRCVYGYWNKA